MLIAYALLMFVPFAWMVITSFKTQPDAVQMTWFPDPFTLDGWNRAFDELNPNIVKLFFNSAIIAGAVTLSNVALGAMAGYAFARLRFRGREILFILVLATMMIPDQLRLVPVYQIMRQAGPDRRLGPIRIGGPGHGHRRGERVPDAPVLPVDPARPRGGGQDRRCGLFHHVPGG